MRFTRPDRHSIRAALSGAAIACAVLIVAWVVYTMATLLATDQVSLAERTALREDLNSQADVLAEQQAALDQANQRLLDAGRAPVPTPDIPEGIGPAGSDGSDGADGIDGNDGAPGATGPRGRRGPRGVEGQAGADGEGGATGAAGKAGGQGPPGPTGPAGPTGQPGPKGDKGDKGETGAGEPGTDGSDGTDALPFSFAFTVPARNPSETDQTYRVRCTVDGCTVERTP